jgi:ubiquinone/menaquinone biosynthesis C-methylase UbiE
VAPGPGYLAIELARASFRVAADISHSFVEMGRAHAARAGVEVDFRHGNAAALPFEEGTLYCVRLPAAFKNFTEPVRAVSEMRRVLKPGGRAVIVDMRSDASRPAIDACVKGMGMGWINSLITKWSLRSLVSRAYSRVQLREITSQAGFRCWRIAEEGIGFELSLEN